jgi:PAS domain S-box-containing protein
MTKANHRAGMKNLLIGRFCMVLAVLLLSVAVWAGEHPKLVILLDSYGRNVAPFSNVIAVFRTELLSQSPEAIDLHEISLETARFAQPEHEVPFVNFLRERFAGRNPDLVAAVGGPAFTFLVRHRDHLFADTPVLVTGVAEQILQSGALPRNTVVVPLRVDLQGLVEGILKVLPDTENIDVILGASALERFWLDECRRDFEPFSSRVKFTYLDQLPFKEIIRRVASLPAGSAIFFGLLVVDAAGTPYEPGEALKAIIASATAPVFALHETFFGIGTVGGRHLQERASALQATEAALHLLQGRMPASASSSALPSGAPVYDWRALQRWGIRENRLPPGSTVEFRPPSPWSLYRWHIAGGVILLIFQALLIARLLVQKRYRVRTERELKRSEQRLRLITNALPVLIAYVDSEQRYRFNNDAYKTWFGVNAEAALGRTIQEVVGERFYRSVRPYLERALSGEQVRFAQDIELGGGRMVSVEAIYVPDMDEVGAVRGLYILAMDVTERNLARQESKRLQDELLHAGRISTMGELAGALAHEINQPLSAIMSNAQAARRYLNAPTPDLEEVREILDDIVKEDARAGEVINRLRALLKKTKTEFESIDLNLLFREVVGLLHSDAVIRNVTVSTELDPLLPLVRGDRIQLQQVALNLMLNAFEAMNERANGERGVLIRTGRKDDQILAAVADIGHGIAAGEAEKIFKPFYTSKPQGLGMGLSICRSIINSHHGRLWVENNPDCGATFYFSLPAPAEELISKQG